MVLALSVLSVALAQSDKPKDVIASSSAVDQSAVGDPLKSITIHQEIDFKASPSKIYESLLNAKQFTAFSGRPAEINRELGGACSLFGGHMFDHVGFPEGLHNHLAEGWEENYWSLLKKYFH